MGKILGPDRLQTVATGAFGRPAEASARCAAFFRGAFYLGSSYADLTGPDNAPRILRYARRKGEWEAVYQSPLIEPGTRSSVPDRRQQLYLAAHGFEDAGAGRIEGRVPRDAGYRSMCVFQGGSDPEPALYVSSMSRGGGVLLRSRDGRTFEELGEPGLGDPDIYSFDALTVLDGRLFAVPAGSLTNDDLDADEPYEARILVSDDPGAGNWQDAAEIAFGDQRNTAISALCAAHGQLYAATANPERGCQLWRTEAKGTPPYKWDPVFVDGAGAFNHNLAVTAMAEFNGSLYVGSGIPGFGRDVVYDVGPGSAELLRVYPDGTWDLIAGRMRFTDQGLKVPLSLLGPGLGDFYNSAVTALAAHAGVLYLGTRHWEPLHAVETGAAEIAGGYQLWASENGEDWQLVLDDGNGNPAQLGIATLAATPIGLFVGSDNHGWLLRLLGRETGRSDLQFSDGFEVLLAK